MWCRYGSRAVDLLRRYYEGQMTNVMSEDEEGAGPSSTAGAAAAGHGNGAASQGAFMVAAASS